MLNRVRQQLSVLCLVLLPGPLSHANAAWNLLHAADFDWQSKPARYAVAEDLAHRTHLLLGAVPKQRESTRARIETSLAGFESADDDVSDERARLFLSADFQQYRLLNLLEGISRDLKCVMDAPVIETEMVCWAQVMRAQMEGDLINLAINTLRDKRRMPREESLPVLAQDPGFWYSEYARGIARELLIPYLQSTDPSAGGMSGETVHR